MVEPPVSYLRVHGPYRCLRDGYRIEVCRLHVFYVFYLPCSTSSTTLSLLRHFLRTTTAIAKKKITGAELTARAKANGYQRGAHRDKDSLRDRNKHVDKVKRDQDAAFDRYVM